MGQRVGANQRQFHQIKKMLADGVSQHIISKTFNIEPQSLERICAHIEGREVRQLAIENNPEVQALKAELAAIKEKYGITEDHADAEEQLESAEVSEDDQEEESSSADAA